MQLPQAAMTSNAAVDDSNTTAESILMKAIITDIVRLQGEELIRVRSELEKTQSLNASALELMRVTECRMSELQDTSHQRRLKMLALQETLAEMQNENDDLSNSLKITRERLHIFCRLVEQPSPSGKQEPERERQNNLHSFQDRSMMTEGEDITSTAVATAPDQKLTEVIEGINTTASAAAITPKQLSTEAREGEATSPEQLSTEDFCTSSLPDVVLGPETDISLEYRRSLVDALNLHGAVQQGSPALKETDRSKSEPFSTGVEQWYISDPSSLMDESNGDTNSSDGGNYPEEDVDDVPHLGVSIATNHDRPITPFDVAYSSDEEDHHLAHVAVLSTDEQTELDRVKNLIEVVLLEMGMSKPVPAAMECASEHKPTSSLAPAATEPTIELLKPPSQPALVSAEPAASASKSKLTPASADMEPTANVSKLTSTSAFTATEPTVNVSKPTSTSASAAAEPTVNTSKPTLTSASAAIEPTVNVSKPTSTSASTATEPTVNVSKLTSTSASAVTEPKNVSKPTSTSASAATEPTMNASKPTSTSASAATEATVNVSKPTSTSVSAATEPIVNISKPTSKPVPAVTEPTANAPKLKPTSTPAPYTTEPKPSDTLVGSGTSQYSTSSGTTRFVTAFSLCYLPITLAKLPQSPGDKLKVKQICSKALGYSPTFLEGPYLRAKVIIDLDNQDKAILIVVSGNDTTPSKILKKCKTGTRWKETFIAMEHSGSGRNLYILGEYEYRGYSPTKLALSDYNLLPEAAKDFIFDSGRCLKGIRTKQQVAESLVKQGGIAIHKIVLEAIRSKKTLEELIVKEARSKGHY